MSEADLDRALDVLGMTKGGLPAVTARGAAGRQRGAGEPA